jgi:hypothetical protein
MFRHHSSRSTDTRLDFEREIDELHEERANLLERETELEDTIQRQREVLARMQGRIDELEGVELRDDADADRAGGVRSEKDLGDGADEAGAMGGWEGWAPSWAWVRRLLIALIPVLLYLWWRWVNRVEFAYLAKRERETLGTKAVGTPEEGVLASFVGVVVEYFQGLVGDGGGD